MEQKRIENVMKAAGEYVNALTVNSTHNIPREIVADEKKFFTWVTKLL